MRTWRLLFVGFGTVGRGTATRLVAAAAELAEQGVEARIVGVVDPVAGSIAQPRGLSPQALLDCVAADRPLTELEDAQPIDDAFAAIEQLDPDVVLEMTPTDLRTGGVGLEHVRAALAAGCHVATTNKGPIALAYPELAELAARQRVQLRAEGTVLSGTPVLNLAESGLVGAGARAFRGILNGTCNYIISEMESGRGYGEALAEAQRLGYAETDPSGDVEGWDAAAKVTILANLVLGADLVLDDVERQGIDALDAGRVREDAEAGRPWRLVGSACREGDGWRAVVEPVQVDGADPLAGAHGPTNMLVFETDALGDVTIVGPGAGGDATGHALVADLLAIHRASRS